MSNDVTAIEKLVDVFVDVIWDELKENDITVGDIESITYKLSEGIKKRADKQKLK